MVGAEDEDDAKFALDQTAMVCVDISCLRSLANTNNQELLQSLPGINSVNSRIISRHVRNISELCQTSQEQLAEWIGEAPARQLYRFLHNRAQ
jgi:ERCC4-type nuclease